MIEDCPETDIEFDARRFTSAHELRHAECFTGIGPTEILRAVGPMLPRPAQIVRSRPSNSMLGSGRTTP
jgi:hypothetical protein